MSPVLNLYSAITNAIGAYHILGLSLLTDLLVLIPKIEEGKNLILKSMRWLFLALINSISYYLFLTLYHMKRNRMQRRNKS